MANSSPGPHGRFELYAVAVPELSVTFVTEAEWNTVRPNSTHSHPEMQMIWIVQGRMEVHLQSRSFVLKPGGACVLAPNLKHRVAQDPRAPRVQFLDMRFKRHSPLEHYMEGFGGQIAFQLPSATLRSHAQELRRIQRLRGAQRDARLLAELWSMLAGLSQSEVPSLTSGDPEPSGECRLELADGFMRDSLTSNVDVAAVAAHVGLSRSQLTRLYLRHQKLGPAARFQQLRVERATRLLTASALTVKEIAHACGFVCPNHFCRVFRKLTRKTPSHYRASVPVWKN